MVVLLVYDSVMVSFVFFPKMWGESLFVYMAFVDFEKEMIAIESEVIAKILLVWVMHLYLVISFSNLLSLLLF